MAQKVTKKNTQGKLYAGWFKTDSKPKKIFLSLALVLVLASTGLVAYDKIYKAQAGGLTTINPGYYGLKIQACKSFRAPNKYLVKNFTTRYSTAYKTIYLSTSERGSKAKSSSNWYGLYATQAYVEYYPVNPVNTVRFFTNITSGDPWPLNSIRNC